MSPRALRLGFCASLVLAGCAERIERLTAAPDFSVAGSPERLVTPPPAPERLALAVPTPPVAPAPATPASLWQSGPTSLFGDRRANGLGDILTVVIEIDDEAAISNATDRARDAADEVSVRAFLGLPSVADVVLPGAGTLEPAIGAASSTQTAGSGSIVREEEITLRLAATVVGVLANGHLVVRGSQEIRINHELRDLQLTGIVRPVDITRQNEITLDKIADARLAYGGRGVVSDVQAPRWGQQVVEAVSPY